MNSTVLIKILEPKTFPASLIPVLYGSAFAWYRYSRFSLLYLILLLLSMALVQGTANMVNDYFDFKRAADSPDKADEKALLSGSVTPRQLKSLIGICIGTSLTIGMVLATFTSPWILIVAAAGLSVLFAYSSGPFPICQTPFGEATAGITMGVGITATVIFIQSGQFNLETIAATIPTVFFIASLLLSNNLADWQEDAAAGRRTAVICLGTNAGSRLWEILTLAQPASAIILTVAGIYPFAAAATAVLLYPYQNAPEYRKTPKERSSKGLLMGSSVRIGVRHHVLVMAGLLIDAALRHIS